MPPTTRCPRMLTDPQIEMTCTVILKLTGGEGEGSHRSRRLHKLMMKQGRMGFRWFKERLGSVDSRVEQVFSLLSCGWAPTVEEIAALPYIEKNGSWGVYLDITIKWCADTQQWVILTYAGESGEEVFERWDGHIVKLKELIRDLHESRHLNQPDNTSSYAHYTKMTPELSNPCDRYLASRYTPFVEIREEIGDEEGLFEDSEFRDIVGEAMDVEGEEEYVVNRIISHHILNGRLSFQVEWEDPTHATGDDNFQTPSVLSIADINDYLSTLSPTLASDLRRFFRVTDEGIINRRRPVLDMADRFSLSKSLEGFAISHLKHERSVLIRLLQERLWINTVPPTNLHINTNDRKAYFFAGADPTERNTLESEHDDTFIGTAADRHIRDQLWQHSLSQPSPHPIVLTPCSFGPIPTSFRTNPSPSYESTYTSQISHLLPEPSDPQARLDLRKAALAWPYPGREMRAEAGKFVQMVMGQEAVDGWYSEMGEGGVVKLWDDLVITFPGELFDAPVEVGEKVVVWVEARYLNSQTGLLLPSLTTIRLLTLSLPPLQIRLTPSLTALNPILHAQLAAVCDSVSFAIASHRSQTGRHHKIVSRIKWRGNGAGLPGMRVPIGEVLGLAGEIEEGMKGLGLKSDNPDVFVVPCMTISPSATPIHPHLALLHHLLNSPPTIKDGIIPSKQHLVYPLSRALNISQSVLPQSLFVVHNGRLVPVIIEGKGRGIHQMWSESIARLAKELPGMLSKLLENQEKKVVEGKVGKGLLRVGYSPVEAIVRDHLVGYARKADGEEGRCILGPVIGVEYTKK